MLWSLRPMKLTISIINNFGEIKDQDAGEDSGVDAVADVGRVVVRLAPSDDDVLLGRQLMKQIKFYLD